MKIGVSGFAWTASLRREHFNLFPRLRKEGFEAFEVPMFAPFALPISELRRAFEANDLECTVCAIPPPGINPISPDVATRKRSLQHLSDCVKTAADMGSRLLGGPLFSPIGYLPQHRPTPDEWNWAIEAFRSVGQLLDEHEMTLSIEPVNRSETFFLRTGSKAKEMCEAVGHERVGVTMDTFHANIEEKSIPAAIESLGTHLRHLHLSENDRGVLGSGHIDFAPILEAAANVKYDGYLMIEGFGFSPYELEAPGTLWADERLSPEEFASESLAYLKALLN